MPPNIIPKQCLRLNSPYMLDAVLNKVEQTSEPSFNEAERDFSLLVLESPDSFDCEDYPGASVSKQNDHDWIENNAVYNDWLAQDGAQSRLWIFGGARSSRTSLALAILDKLEETGPGIQVLHFSCHRSYRHHREACAIVQSWLYQLIQQRPDLTGDVCAWICRPLNRMAHLYNANLLWNKFREALCSQNAGVTYCMLDGLQECDEENKQAILDLITRQHPYECCSEGRPKLKFLVTAQVSSPIGSFKTIELEDRMGYGPVSSASDRSMLDRHVDGLSTEDDRNHAVRLLKLAAAYQRVPTIGQLQTQSTRSEKDLLDCIKLCEPLVKTVSDDCVVFIDLDTWSACVESQGAADIHAELAKSCFDIIREELPKIDMADLEDSRCTWVVDVTAELRYAVMYWAAHVKLSSDSPEKLLDMFMATFNRDSTVLEKWHIMYTRYQYRVSVMSAPQQHHHTTPMHLMALFDLHALLKAVESSEQWFNVLQRYLGTTDARNLRPLEIALLYGHNETAKYFITRSTRSNILQCKFAAGSNAYLSSQVFEKFNVNGPPIEYDTMYDILWSAITKAEPALVTNAVKFLIAHCRENMLPWDNISLIQQVMIAGQRTLLAPLLQITNLKNQAQIIVEFAVTYHASDMLTDLLSHEIIQKMIQARQINLVNALNIALSERCPAMVTQLMDEHVIHKKDQHGFTPLQIAVMYPNPRTLALFLGYTEFSFSHGHIEEGIALNLILHSAGVEIDITVLEQLLDRGARMRYEHFGMTALHVAAELGRPEVMQTLLDKLSNEDIEAGINIQCTSCHGEDREDKTALAIAAAKGHVEVARMLLKKGANTRIKDKKGLTARELAETGEFGDVVSILEEYEGGKGKKGKGKGKK